MRIYIALKENKKRLDVGEFNTILLFYLYFSLKGRLMKIGLDIVGRKVKEGTENIKLI